MVALPAAVIATPVRAFVAPLSLSHVAGGLVHLSYAFTHATSKAAPTSTLRPVKAISTEKERENKRDWAGVPTSPIALVPRLSVSYEAVREPTRSILARASHPLRC